MGASAAFIEMENTCTPSFFDRATDGQPWKLEQARNIDLIPHEQWELIQDVGGNLLDASDGMSQIHNSAK